MGGNEAGHVDNGSLVECQAIKEFGLYLKENGKHLN